VISKEFLESENCTSTVLELRKDNDYKSKMLLIIHENANINRIGGSIPYVKYWNEKLNTLTKLSANLPMEATSTISEELALLRYINNEIGKFIDKDIKQIFVPLLSELKKSNYKEVIEKIFKLPL